MVNNLLKNISTMEAKINLKVQMISRKLSINDVGFLDYLRKSIDEEGDLYIHSLCDCLINFLEVPFNFIEIPERILQDHLEGWEYYIAGAIHIPSLMPYVQHPSFVEFTRNLEIFEYGCGNADLIEFIYLPESLIATSEDPEYRNFANQPATFMVGIQDNGGIDLETNVQFMLRLKNINHYLCELVKDEGREIA